MNSADTGRERAIGWRLVVAGALIGMLLCVLQNTVFDPPGAGGGHVGGLWVLGIPIIGAAGAIVGMALSATVVLFRAGKTGRAIAFLVTSLVCFVFPLLWMWIIRPDVLPLSVLAIGAVTAIVVWIIVMRRPPRRR